MGQTTEEMEKIQVRPFVTTPASVSVKFGRTINIGDFESVRIDVMLTMPCYKEEIVSVYTKTRNAVEKLVSREVDRIEKAHSGSLEDL